MDTVIKWTKKRRKGGGNLDRIMISFFLKIRPFFNSLYEQYS